MVEEGAGSMQGPMVERLTRGSKGELVEAMREAFAQHPMMHALGGTAEDAGALVRALVDFYWGKKSLLLCGVRTHEGVVCGSLSVDAREDHSLLALARLAWVVTRALGWGALGPLLDEERHKPFLQERHLEMVILATAPAYQRQGFGRSVLHFLYREAMREGYGGILLVSDRDTPAFGLYRSEGFQVEREFEVAQQRLCWMRRAV
jgi:ribosomal protein S18 acetylase RimI-like enzyme